MGSPSSFQFSPTSMDKFSSPSDIERHVSDQTNSRPSSRLHETHFGSSVNSIPCTVVHSPMDSMVHSPIEVSSLSPDQLHITPIATIDGRKRSVREGSLDGDGGASGGGCGGGPHGQLARTR